MARDWGGWESKKGNKRRNAQIWGVLPLRAPERRSRERKNVPKKVLGELGERQESS